MYCPKQKWQIKKAVIKNVKTASCFILTEGGTKVQRSRTWDAFSSQVAAVLRRSGCRAGGTGDSWWAAPNTCLPLIPPKGRGKQMGPRCVRADSLQSRLLVHEEVIISPRKANSSHMPYFQTSLLKLLKRLWPQSSDVRVDGEAVIQSENSISCCRLKLQQRNHSFQKAHDRVHVSKTSWKLNTGGWVTNTWRSTVWYLVDLWFLYWQKKEIFTYCP